MTHLVSDSQRRIRLGVRHALSTESQVGSGRDVAACVVAIHGTDPASTVLAIKARAPGSTLQDIERELYDERVLVRVLGMRRTIFAVDYLLAPSVWEACDYTVARTQRRQLQQLIGNSGIEDADAWIRSAEERLLEAIDSAPGSTSTQLAAADSMLSHRVLLPGNTPTPVQASVASRLLTLLSAEGKVVRARPQGGWTSTQFTWASSGHWRSDWPDRPASPEEADAAIAGPWLAKYGPGTVEDFQWWTGWSKGRVRKAFAAVGAAEVALDNGQGWLLESDLDDLPATSPWAALLPGLDPSIMGWRDRTFYLGSYAPRLFDADGNAGASVWVDGRCVGGWTQLDDGNVVFELFEDIGAEATANVESAAAGLQEFIAGVRIKPRARRWTPSELALRGRYQP